MMSDKKIEIISQNRAYDGYLKIDEAVINETDESGEQNHYTRFKLTRPDAAAVLVYNQDTDSVVMVKQHRYPIYGKFEGDLLEVVAGKVDEGEDPLTAAIREVEEEIGYKIEKNDMRYRGSYFPSPGYSSEIIHLYIVKVHDKDKISEGGGVEGEHENIEIVNVPTKNFFDMVANGEIVDGKTIAAANAFWHLRNDSHVQKGIEYYNKYHKIEQKAKEDALKQEDADETK